MHMHARAHAQSFSSSTRFLCLTPRVLYLLAIQAHLVRFQTVVFWVLVVNSGHSESPAEGAWPRALVFSNQSSLRTAPTQARVCGEVVQPRGSSLTWLVRLGRGQEAASLPSAAPAPQGSLLSAIRQVSAEPLLWTKHHTSTRGSARNPAFWGRWGVVMHRQVMGVTTHQHRDARESFSREELPSRNLRNE